MTRSSHTATVEDVDDTLIGGANTHKEDFGRLITARPKSVDEEILRALRMIYTLDVVLPKIDDELIGGRKPCCFIFFRVAIYRLVGYVSSVSSYYPQGSPTSIPVRCFGMLTSMTAKPSLAAQST